MQGSQEEELQGSQEEELQGSQEERQDEDEDSQPPSPSIISPGPIRHKKKGKLIYHNLLLPHKFKGDISTYLSFMLGSTWDKVVLHSS